MSKHVEQRGEAYYVTGTRISLDSVVYAFLRGESPETIRENFYTLTLPKVYGAISYDLDNWAEVDAYLRKREEAWAELERQGTPPSEDLKARIERARERLCA
jgi:uncharacterized protein (DUF433 family)